MRARLPFLIAALLMGGAAFPAFGQDQQPADSFEISVDAGQERFDGSTDPWSEVSFKMGAKTGIGSVNGMFNFAERFGRTGTQLEIEAYPDLGSGRYAYLNYGWSDSGIFPHARYGAEYFQSLPASFEASLGMRHMRFSSSNVTLWTGSVGHYRGNYWFSLRPYIKPDDGDLSTSLHLSVRRFGRDRYDYWGVRVGGGRGAGDFVTEDEIFRDRSFSTSLERRFAIAPRWVGKISAGVKWEELSPTRDRTRYGLSFGVRRTF